MEMDPLLKDLNDKNNRLRRNALTMAMELKNTRGRLISKEKSFAREEERRMEAESTALKLEKELFRLQNHQDEKCCQRRLEEQMASPTIENPHFPPSKSTHHNFPSILNGVVDGKCSSSIKEHKEQKYQPSGLPQTRCISPHNLKYGMCQNNFEKVQNQLVVRDEEMAVLIDDIRMIFDHFELKTVELQSKVRVKHRLEKELKKRVLKLEFFLHETRSQGRRLHRILEKRDRDVKNLKREIEAIKEERNIGGTHGFWQSSSFKVAVSMSMVMLIALSRS